MKLSLCTPTRRRPERFSQMVHSALSTAEDVSRIEVVAYLDNGLPSYFEDTMNVRFVHGPRPTNDGYTMMSGLWSRAWEKATGDIAMLNGDDVIFETPGWDSRVQAAFESVPDRLVMVYANAGAETRPILPFVSREWIDVVGFTPDDLQGWFSDEWIWSLAAEIGRVIYLDDVMIRHNQYGNDETYAEGARARERAGGLQAMRTQFYSVPQVKRRDALVTKLRAAKTSDYYCVPVGSPKWLSDSLLWAQQARELDHKIQNETLVVVHCYAGDKQAVKHALPVHLAHNGHVLVVSPEDAPVTFRRKDVECVSAGKRGYFGQESLDRQRQHLELLLKQPYNYFLLNDSDSVCLEAALPRYLYVSTDIVWSNEVLEWRPHWSPYPKIAMQPPYFLSRECIIRMLNVADKPEVRAHPITPYIDWYMLALTEEAGLRHRTFPDGASFPAWRRNDIEETQLLGHEPKHENDPNGYIRGDLMMKEKVELGAIFIHSVKHPEILDMLVETHRDYVRKGSPPVNTITIEEYVHQQQQPDTVRVAMGSWGDGDRIQI